MTAEEIDMPCDAPADDVGNVHARWAALAPAAADAAAPTPDAAQQRLLH